MKGYQRNFPCPCKSGKKWKVCHPEMGGVYKDQEGNLIRERKPEVIMPIQKLTPEERKKRFGV